MAAPDLQAFLVDPDRHMDVGEGAEEHQQPGGEAADDRHHEGRESGGPVGGDGQARCPAPRHAAPTRASTHCIRLWAAGPDRGRSLAPGSACRRRHRSCQGRGGCCPLMAGPQSTHVRVFARYGSASASRSRPGPRCSRRHGSRHGSGPRTLGRWRGLGGCRRAAVGTAGEQPALGVGERGGRQLRRAAAEDHRQVARAGRPPGAGGSAPIRRSAWAATAPADPWRAMAAHRAGWRAARIRSATSS